MNAVVPVVVAEIDVILFSEVVSTAYTTIPAGKGEVSNVK